jgi:hypothetical protein
MWARELFRTRVSRSFVRGEETRSSFYLKSGVNGAVGVTPDQREIRRGNKHRAAQSSTSSKVRKSPQAGLPARHEYHQRVTNSDGARSARPSQSPRRKRAANPRKEQESGALPPKVTSGATVALSDSRDQCSITASDRAAAVPATEPPSHSVSSPVTGRRRTPPMEANGCGSKKTRLARGYVRERRSSAPTQLPARSSTKTHTPSDFSTGSSRAITELDRGLSHIGAMAQECHIRNLFTPVYSFDNAAEDMPEDEEDPYDITIANEYPYTNAGSERGPEAAVFPKQLLPVTPPIWAEVRRVGCGRPNHVGNMLSSRDRRCASPLTTSGVFKAVFIIYVMWPKDTFLAGIPLCQFHSGSPPNLADNLIAVIYSTTAEGLSSRMGKGSYVSASIFIEAGSRQRRQSRSPTFKESLQRSSGARRPVRRR